MCGITGIIQYNGINEARKEELKLMTEAIKHRGPDASGYYEHPCAVLGHRRLIVIDPEGGKQPMIFTQGYSEYILIYNGELYNTDELRKKLIEKGYSFEGHSDTEVVLKSYVEWGEDCVSYFNGIFAFAVWESLSKTLFMARDRAGVKPLFYAQIGGCFIFASEIKALLKCELIEPIFNENSLLELFSLGPSRVPGSGLYKNINEVKPAEFIYLTEKMMHKKIYWRPQTNIHSEGISSTIEQLSGLVEDAIRIQLVSDVPICTFLSGGLDSSAISSIASKYFKENNKGILTTYSIDYEDNETYFNGDSFQPTNDQVWVNRMTNYIQSDHKRFIVDIESLASSLTEATLANDYPGMADIDSSLLLFCGEVKKENTVALSGECADEIFGGYPWYRNESDVFYQGFPWNKHLTMRSSFLSENLAKLPLQDFAHSAYQDTIAEVEYLGHESEFDRAMRRLTYLNYKWFMTTLLTRKDRMSMFNSLEVRVPYADHRIMEYAYNIPWKMKNLDGVEKGILRAALSKHLPSDVLGRKKSPYPKTYHPKYNEILSQLFQEIMMKKDSPIHGLINEKKVNNLIREDMNLFHTPWFGQLMKGPQFIAYLIQLNYFMENNHVKIQGI